MRHKSVKNRTWDEYDLKTKQVKKSAWAKGGFEFSSFKKKKGNVTKRFEPCLRLECHNLRFICVT